MHKQTAVLIVSVVLAAGYWLYSSYQKHANLNKHLAVQQHYWEVVKYSQLPIEKRVFDVSPTIVDYLGMDNLRQGWPNQPKPVQLSKEQKEIVEENLKSLPDGIRKKLTSLLAGLVFVKDLGGSAVSNSIYNSNGVIVGGFIAFDEIVLKKNANQWAQDKEKSPFDLKDSSQSLEMIIENPSEDNVKNAFRFILLHELGHILSLNEGMYPPWEHKKVPLLSELLFYSESSKANLVDVYSSLEKSEFPTLYSASNPYDDFADSFASYMHVVLEKKPYRVTVLQGKEPVKTFTSCWGTERCRRKQEVLAEMFAEKKSGR